jgi:hypothetical protein
MSSAGFEPAIPANKLPQTYALGRAATGIGLFLFRGIWKKVGYICLFRNIIFIFVKGRGTYIYHGALKS